MTQVQVKPAGSNPAETYEGYFVPAMFRPWAAELLNRVAIRPGERVLDLACGTGAVTRQVAPLVGATGTLVGVDFSPAMLAVARDLPAPPGAGIDWREGSADALPFPDGSFGLVLCQQGLQFFPDRAAAMREMHRVLAPDGRAGVSVWRGLDHQPVFAAFDAASERHFGVPAEDIPFSLGDADELRTLFTDAGFRETSIEVVTRPVRFPLADQFVQLTTLGAAAVTPSFAAMNEAEREALVDAISQDLAEPLRAYRNGADIVFPMSAHIAVARA